MYMYNVLIGGCTKNCPPLPPALLQEKFLLMKAIIILPYTLYLDEPNMAGYGITDVQNVGVFVHNYQETIYCLRRES